ncbi:MAG TPA: DUF2867 domain-containing protein [Myxococcota bacterium]|nr:DUF2867 domain-containing protein [Myxococcota bacterium]
MRASPDEWNRLELRVHEVLRGTPLHDVWSVDLPGGRPGLTLSDLQGILSERLVRSNAAVRFLFWLRFAIGRVFGWERVREHKDPPPIFRDRLTESDRKSSLVPPGTAEGPFRVLYVRPRESASEIWNATVHAVSSYALVERADGYRLYWAIYVRSVGRITPFYMRLIDPFRRFIVYPALLRAVRAAWMRDFAGAARG